MLVGMANSTSLIMIQRWYGRKCWRFPCSPEDRRNFSEVQVILAVSSCCKRIPCGGNRGDCLQRFGRPSILNPKPAMMQMPCDSIRSGLPGILLTRPDSLRYHSTPKPLSIPTSLPDDSFHFLYFRRNLALHQDCRCAHSGPISPWQPAQIDLQ